MIPLPDGTTTRELETGDGAVLRVLERGAASLPPLVLVHGITMHAATWTYQLRDLADRFHVVAYDQRGHGDSSAGADGFGLSALARDLGAVLRDPGRDDAVVVGHSMGAAALMRLWRDEPEVLEATARGLVFLSAGPGFDLRPLTERIVRAGNGAALRAVERVRFRPWYRFPPGRVSTVLIRTAFGEAPRAEHLDWTRAMVAANDAEAMLRSGFGMGDHDGRRAVRTLRLPSLVVVGSRDRLTSPRLARRIQRELPPDVGRLEVVEGAGHQVMLERPTELAALLAAFADELASSASRERAG